MRLAAILPAAMVALVAATAAAAPPVITEFPVSEGATPDLITVGPDGALWFTDIFADRIGRISYAFDPNFRGGVRVAACDFTGDGRAEIVAGAGPGGGPQVRVIPLDAAGNPLADLASFFAFDPAFTGGVTVASSP